MSYGHLIEFYKTRTHSRVRGGCHMSTFSGQGVTTAIQSYCNSQRLLSFLAEAFSFGLGSLLLAEPSPKWHHCCCHQHLLHVIFYHWSFHPYQRSVGGCWKSHKTLRSQAIFLFLGKSWVHPPPAIIFGNWSTHTKVAPCSHHHKLRYGTFVCEFETCSSRYKLSKFIAFDKSLIFYA